MDPYVYPGTDILQNRLGLQDQAVLERRERLLTTVRSRTAPMGDFDLAHLQDIHRHLFQDIYGWAGKMRTVEMTKAGNRFQLSHLIPQGMDEVHGHLQDLDFLRGLSRADFARQAGFVIGEVNFIHPFPEGNGRTQVKYLEQLSSQAGHFFSRAFIDRDRWIAASRAAFHEDHRPLGEEIERVIIASGPMSDVTPTASDRFLNWMEPRVALSDGPDCFTRVTGTPGYEFHSARKGGSETHTDTSRGPTRRR